MLNLGGWNENPAVEIGEHPLGPSLGTIDTNDTEVLRADPLDTWTDHAMSLVNALGAAQERFLDLAARAMGKTSWKESGEKTDSPAGSLHGFEG